MYVYVYLFKYTLTAMSHRPQKIGKRPLPKVTVDR